MSSGKKKHSCLMLGLMILLIVLVVIAVVSFVLTSFFDLGVWDEFWEMVGKKIG